MFPCAWHGGHHSRTIRGQTMVSRWRVVHCPASFTENFRGAHGHLRKSRCCAFIEHPIGGRWTTEGPRSTTAVLLQPSATASLGFPSPVQLWNWPVTGVTRRYASWLAGCWNLSPRPWSWNPFATSRSTRSLLIPYQRAEFRTRVFCKIFWLCFRPLTLLRCFSLNYICWDSTVYTILWW